MTIRIYLLIDKYIHISESQEKHDITTSVNFLCSVDMEEQKSTKKLSILKVNGTGGSLAFPLDGRCAAQGIFRSYRPEVFCKKGVPKNIVDSQENTCVRTSFLMKLQALHLQLY